MQAIGKKISCIEESNKGKIVEFFYRNESSEFHNRIHKRGGTIEENIKDTLDSMSEKSKFYVVQVGIQVAAFFGRYEENGIMVLEGFHVRKDFRKGWFLDEFWKIVKAKMGQCFYVGLHPKNEPAIEHLLRQGFEFIEILNIDNNTIYKFRYTDHQWH